MTKRKSKKRRPPAWKQEQKEAKKKKRAEERQTRTSAQITTETERIIPTLPWPEPRQDTPWDDYRFLNPYNFVRYLPEPTISVDDAEATLLGRCPPPPHDRYVGLRGQITCRLETITPLFIADSHNVRITRLADEGNKPREHKSYRFFQVGGEDAIPGTSLRGMVRSVFEAVTNSCFGVFTPEKRLDYRQVEIAQKMKAAIVTKIPADEQDNGEAALCEDARLPAYTDDVKIKLEDWECGEKGYTIVSRGKLPKVQEWVARDPNIYANDERNVTEGWVKITGRTIPGKKHERFFFYSKGKEQAQKSLFSWERMQDYNAILKAQIEDETRGFRTRYQHRRLTVGDLVYVRLNDDKSEVLDISLVKVPRLKFRKALADLLPKHLHPCISYEALCPACRTFGWVKHAHQRGISIRDSAERTAYAGRVRFSFGKLIEDKGIYEDELSLTILSTPKPTTALFYLFEGDPQEPSVKLPNGDQNATYKDGYKLRGRKFYRHHGEQLNRQEYERAGGKRDHQNRSVRGVRVPGNVFKFTVDFENLAPVELGALLWSLNLDGQGFHRLGYAKPLGFGSVKIIVERVDVVEWQQRLQSIDPNTGWRQATILEKSKWIATFVKAMEQVYGEGFEQLDHIQDLLSLLREPVNLPIHYPRTNVVSDPEGRNFEWFEENTRKSKKGKQAGPHYALDLSVDDDKGLPLQR